MMTEHIKEIAQRITVLRDFAGYSTSEVAEQISVPQEEYERYESGHCDIPVSVLYEIAHLYKIDLTEVLTGQKAKLHTYSLVKKGKGIGIERTKDYLYKNLAYNYAQRRVEPLLVYVEPKEKGYQVTPNFHEGHEFHYCLEGSYLITIGDKELIIEEGDALYFDSKYPHGMRVSGDKPAKILVIVI
ncbi:hypothetical protein SDC9_149576 [bioreactor metagenome]|uniref:HTH cro/C1-type domain-containing protein n=1 Tax=bioreactor metagenome TaxID=1076179 RepID=A0A645ELW9_9ZZZZ